MKNKFFFFIFASMFLLPVNTSYCMEEVEEKTTEKKEITDIFEAFEKKAWDIVGTLLEEEKNAYAIKIRETRDFSKYEQTVLHEAVKHNGLSFVMQIVKTYKKNEKLEEIDRKSGFYNETAMHIAVEKEFLPIMDYLGKWGAKKDETDIHGKTPLMRAIEGRKFQAAAWLIKNGADVNAIGDKMETALHKLARIKIEKKEEVVEKVGALSVLELLLENGADVNALTRESQSVMHVAVFAGNRWFIDRLLEEEGVELETYDFNLKHTPLLSSVYFGCPKITKLLVEKGKADVNAETMGMYKQNALDLAISNYTSSFYKDNDDRNIRFLVEKMNVPEYSTTVDEHLKKTYKKAYEKIRNLQKIFNI